MSWPAPPGLTGYAVAAVGPLPAEGVAAIAASGGTLTGALDWEAVDDLAPGSLHPLVVAAAPGDIGHGSLERLAAILDDAGLAAVVACEADALDAVAAVLMGPRVQLLRDPTPGDWATALAIAAVGAGARPAGVREGGDEGERLRRLNEEVARIAALLAGLVEEGTAAAGTVDDRRTAFTAGPTGDVAIDPAEIRRVIRARRVRAHFFDARLLEDPGWDMLLDLFAAELEGGQVSVSSLCIAAAVAPTTALRWISRMAEAGLLVRVADPGDRRRAFLALSERASGAMRGYVGAVRRAGLGVA